MAASQTWSMQTSRGETAQLARYSVVSRIGTFLGPVLVGAAWDLFGAWAAFACVALCGVGAVVSAAQGGTDPNAVSVHQKPRLTAVLLPRWEQHRHAVALALIPAVAFVLAVSFLRNASGAIQSSFYVVYLDGIGMGGTLIGLLVALAELFGVYCGSIINDRMKRADGCRQKFHYGGSGLTVRCDNVIEQVLHFMG